jgi:hypothetical protein
MRVSSKLGKLLVVVVMMFGGGVFAGECKKDPGLLISHELKTERNLICIAYSDNDVVISVYQLGARRALLAKNVTLLDSAEISEGAVRLEPSGDGFKIYLEYPNNIYVVKFGVDAAFVSESFAQIKLEAIKADSAPQHINLVLNSNVMAGLRFETLTMLQAFDQRALSLGQPLSARITAQKTDVSFSPSPSDLSTQYLVRGDKVWISDFHSGWVKISYQASDHQVDGWIPLAEIL